MLKKKVPNDKIKATYKNTIPLPRTRRRLAARHNILGLGVFGDNLGIVSLIPLIPIESFFLFSHLTYSTFSFLEDGKEAQHGPVQCQHVPESD